MVCGPRGPPPWLRPVHFRIRSIVPPGHAAAIYEPYIRLDVNVRLADRECSPTPPGSAGHGTSAPEKSSTKAPVSGADPAVTVPLALNLASANVKLQWPKRIGPLEVLIPLSNETVPLPIPMTSLVTVPVHVPI